MSLRELPTDPHLATSTSKLLDCFYVPALKHSVVYDRGVGFFTSHWLRLAALGLAGLAANGGRTRIIASPMLDRDDCVALAHGADARTDPKLKDALDLAISDLEQDLATDTLAALAWMIADGLLDFRIAIPTADLDGDFHDKFGIMRDGEGNAVAFHGSPNDSAQAFRNYESISIYYSWIDRREASRVTAESARFDLLWANGDLNLRVYPLPDAVKRNLIAFTTRLPRPYKPPKHEQQSDRWIHQKQAAAAHIDSQLSEVQLGNDADEDIALRLINDEEDRGAEAAAALGADEASRMQLDAELQAVDAMIAIAEPAAGNPDARMQWLETWIGNHMLVDGQWNERRLIIFTEYEATRIYIERQLRRIIMHSPEHERRIATFTGITSPERREAIKRAFNNTDSPLRILICTDAAREGINLQQQCHDLVHFDLPWNPSRLEQRNGRIDRKLQPAPQVFCRYFVYEQRPEDIVLEALVRKTELIQRQLGSAGQVIENRVARRMNDRGILRSDAITLAAAIRDEEADEQIVAAVRALGDEPDGRLARLKSELDELKASLEAARQRVGVDSGELEAVVGLALSRAGSDMQAARTDSVRETHIFALSPEAPAFAQDQSWQSVFDELRERPQKPGERPGQWRSAEDAQVRRISFAPAIDDQGRDAAGVVQVHVEHRLVRRLLSRFLTTGFQSGLNRACVIRSPGKEDRAVLLGRLALYGPNATRLHEEIIPIAADWSGGEGRLSLNGLSASEETGAGVIAELEAALRGAEPVPEAVIARFTPTIQKDVVDLRGALESQAQARRGEVEKELSRRGKEEAAALRALLRGQIDRIRAEQRKDDRQLMLDFDEQQTRQREADRRSWEKKLERLTRDLDAEPERLRTSFEIRAARIETLGMVYLWSGSEG